METLAQRINLALAREEKKAELFANRVRLILLTILAAIAVVNFRSIAWEASILNFSALIIGYTYGIIIFFWMRQKGYHPVMKYVSSCIDIFLLFYLLLMYTTIEIPSVALKNYVFLIVFPLIGMTAFRYDRKLTLSVGVFALLLYLCLVFYLYFSQAITITTGGYEQELFSEEITLVGQSTKLLMLIGYVILIAYLAQYSRKLIIKLVSDEFKLRKQKEMIDWELEVASHVQAQLLPRSYPTIRDLDIYGTVVQGRYVGGDYIDFIKLNDQTLLTVTADVSGKGVPAALVMAGVRASIQLLAPMKLGLENFTMHLNSLLQKSTTRRDFVTFFVAEIDVPRRILTYVNAGHPPPVLCSGGKTILLSQRTIPLGVQPSLPQLIEREVAFSPGSILVSYTDGLLEQTDEQGEQYGEKRLQKFITINSHLDVQSFTSALLGELRGFGGGNTLKDDIGISIIKFTTSPA
jgi:serine phosphatase RsbU (regulator of sigma subunit)